MRLSDANRLRLLYFLVLSCTAAWLPIFADNLKERGFSGLEIGTLLSVTPITMFLIQPFYGMMADRWGYKKCMLVSSVFGAVGFYLFTFEGSFVSLFLITIFMSLFYNGLQPVLDSLTLQLAQRDPSFSYGSIRIAGAVGWASTGIVTGYFIDAHDTTVIFIVSAGTLLLTFLLSFTLPPDTPSTSEGASFQHVRQVITNRDLFYLLLIVFLVSATATTIWNFYSIYMKENGASASLVGYGLSLQGLCEIPLFYFSAAIIRIFKLKYTLIITVMATALRMLLYSQIHNPSLAIFIEVLHGLSWSLFWVACVEYVNKLVKPEWRATGQSLLYAAYFGIGAIIGNYWTGYLYDEHVSLSVIFLINAGIVAVVGLLMLRVIRKTEPVVATPVADLNP